MANVKVSSENLVSIKDLSVEKSTSIHVCSFHSCEGLFARVSETVLLRLCTSDVQLSNLNEIL